MIVFVLFIQIVSLVFYYKFLDTAGDFEVSSNRKYTFEGCLWYIIAGLHFLFVLRFIYVQINFSYTWYEQILELISFAISLFVVIPTSIYYLIKRKRLQKKK